MLLTGISLSHRCAGGVMAFNAELTARVVQECTAQSQTLGSIVALLLNSNPELRPSAQEVLALLGSGGGGNKVAGAALDLCPEYLCCLCQSLVVDATSVCSDDHVFCYMCLDAALQGAKECPRCREPVETAKIRTQRVVNNMADKLAKRVLKPQDMQARLQKIEASKNLRTTRAKEAKEALVSNSEAKTHGLWFRITGAAQLGSACSVLRHRTAGSVVEMFHVNGWFRFRSNGRAGTKWCNSCCVIGRD